MPYNLTTTDRTVLYDVFDVFRLFLSLLRRLFIVSIHNIIFFTKISNYYMICKYVICVLCMLINNNCVILLCNCLHSMKIVCIFAV